MLFALAWKNIWRNKTRSAIIIAAIALGLLGGLLASGISFGMGDQMIASAISTRLAHIQIHQKDFRESRNLADTIPSALELAARIEAMPGVAATAQRVIVTAMASSPVAATGVELIGVIPDQEKRVTDIADKIVEGSYFGTTVRNPIVIGQALARDLGVKASSKIVFTFQSDSGTITGGAFRIAGIFKTVSSSFDKTAAFVKEQDLHRLLGAGSSWHEIAIVVKTRFSIDTVAAHLRPLPDDLHADTWKQLAPDLSYVSESTAATLYIFMIVILSALAFGIVNTMLMVVLERRRELGMLMAVGMPRKTVFGMIVLETIALSLTGACIGMVLTVAAMAVLAHTGINLSIISQGLSQFGIPGILYPSLPFSMYPIVAAMVVLTAIIAAIYPAIRALRLRPSEALRTV